uniref:Uncharacterized protein n=1 Tax=Amphimedon queenslandica TaxID=400682 RepID=A0A1X7UJT9_AMPQE
MVDRGGKSTKAFTPTNLVNHLKKHHKEEFENYEKKKVEKEESTRKDTQQSSLKQLTSKEASDRVRLWDINDSRAQTVHQHVMEMIALDTQPISAVEDVGFTCLLQVLEPRYKLPSPQYITFKILPETYKHVLKSVKCVLDSGRFYSFTTDV